MKSILLLMLIFPFLAPAQEATPCELNRETDPYTKETVISTGFFDLKDATVDISANRFEIDIFFSITGMDKCFDNNSTAMIFFENTKMKLSARNGGSMNWAIVTWRTLAVLKKIINVKISKEWVKKSPNPTKRHLFDPGLHCSQVNNFLPCL
jgi:hypothetical protein